MRITEVKERTPLLIEQLLKVWEDSVKKTHLFLSADEISNIKRYVPEALKNISHLIIAEDENNCPVAFMGLENQVLEMLFLSPEERGKGLGKKLIQYGIENYSINELAVNEQNPLARGFYGQSLFHCILFFPMRAAEPIMTNRAILTRFCI